MSWCVGDVSFIDDVLFPLQMSGIEFHKGRKPKFELDLEKLGYLLSDVDDASAHKKTTRERILRFLHKLRVHKSFLLEFFESMLQEVPDEFDSCIDSFVNDHFENKVNGIVDFLVSEPSRSVGSLFGEDRQKSEFSRSSLCIF